MVYKNTSNGHLNEDEIERVSVNQTRKQENSPDCKYLLDNKLNAPLFLKVVYSELLIAFRSS